MESLKYYKLIAQSNNYLKSKEFESSFEITISILHMLKSEYIDSMKKICSEMSNSENISNGENSLQDTFTSVINSFNFIETELEKVGNIMSFIINSLIDIFFSENMKVKANVNNLIDKIKETIIIIEIFNFILITKLQKSLGINSQQEEILRDSVKLMDFIDIKSDSYEFLIQILECSYSQIRLEVLKLLLKFIDFLNGYETTHYELYIQEVKEIILNNKIKIFIGNIDEDDTALIINNIPLFIINKKVTTSIKHEIINLLISKQPTLFEINIVKDIVNSQYSEFKELLSIYSTKIQKNISYLQITDNKLRINFVQEYN